MSLTKNLTEWNYIATVLHDWVMAWRYYYYYIRYPCPGTDHCWIYDFCFSFHPRSSVPYVCTVDHDVFLPLEWVCSPSLHDEWPSRVEARRVCRRQKTEILNLEAWRRRRKLGTYKLWSGYQRLPGSANNHFSRIKRTKGGEKNKSINVNVYGGKKGQYSLFFFWKKKKNSTFVKFCYQAVVCTYAPMDLRSHTTVWSIIGWEWMHFLYVLYVQSSA